ncbi:MAG: hypothetical protein INR69_01220 [Mucilaginibacter polytrichastri]|nr:hypothetical protein [Mucilaginibacter polytrichastri]
MEPDQLLSLLAGFTVHLQSAKDATALHEVQEALASTIISRSGEGPEFKKYVFENSDLFSVQKIREDDKKRLETIVNKAIRSRKTPTIQAVVRDMPVQSTQLGGATAKSVAGARISKTIPLKTIEGRDIFVDVINIRKLVALYIQGQTEPAILFNSSFSRKIRGVATKPELTREFKVLPDSVWINARLLASNAPAGVYCPLRVKGGKISLSELPVYTAEKLTVAAGVTISVALDLDQKTGFDSDASSPYGGDARDAVIELPKTFAFELRGTTKKILGVGNSSWSVYGQPYTFTYANAQNTVHNPLLGRVAVPLQCDSAVFTIKNCASPFFHLEGSADIKSAWWTIPAATIDITKPPEADSNGGFVIEAANGLLSSWGANEKKTILKTPFLIGEPGRIGLTDLASDGTGVFQTLDTWKDAQNPFGTSFDIFYRKDAGLIYNTLAAGNELLLTAVNTDMHIDRPVKVNGEAVQVRSANSVLVLAVNKTKNSIGLIDDNILWDNKLPAQKIPVVKPLALAMHNALFTVTPANGAILFGECDKDFTRIDRGNLYLAFGLYSYLPTLPDPYAANLGVLEAQFRQNVPGTTVSTVRESRVWMWLISRTQWEKQENAADKVGVSFHFAPLQQALNVEKEVPKKAPGKSPSTSPAASLKDLQNNGVLYRAEPLETRLTDTDIQSIGKTFFSAQEAGTATTRSTTRAASKQNPAVSGRRIIPVFDLEDFALLDVSSKANQMGVAYSGSNQRNMAFMRMFGIQPDPNGQSGEMFPIQVSGLDVVTAGKNARAFTMPQIAWEPVMNFTEPAVNPVDPDLSYDPPRGFNYYPNDGIATRIGNFGNDPVALSPIPMARYLEATYRDRKDGKTYALFNLPFGMLAFSIIDGNEQQAEKPKIKSIEPVFDKYVIGGLQLELQSGSSFSADDEDNVFRGLTIQLINVQDAFGTSSKWSTLGSSVEYIFNGEFYRGPTPANPGRTGVPLKSIGLSGYGASTFSDWHNRDAAFAQTSQALFNVVAGRTANEVVQVRSMIYPYGIVVVRTITIFRLNNGYVARVDSGWQAETDGRFNFAEKTGVDPYKHIHPGLIKGVYNVRNIRENELSFSDDPTDTKLRGVNFDCEVDIENVIEGAGSQGRVPSKGVLGFVQLSPQGVAISPQMFQNLLKAQGGSIGGPVNCTLKVAGSLQHMKVNRFDVNNSTNGAEPAFVGAVRGTVILPKDGSWSMVTHSRQDGMVTPLPEQLSVPLIREGRWEKGKLVEDVSAKLFRIAHPTELLRAPAPDTVNFGFVQNLNSQKVLFLTPSFKTGMNSLLSKTPPLLADAYRLMNTNAIFPNIGDGENSFGTAIQMLSGKSAAQNGLEAFNRVKEGASAVLDGGKQVFELLEIKTREEAGKLADQGYKLIKQKIGGVIDDALNEAFRFDLPTGDYDLVGEDGDPFHVYIQYAAQSKTSGQPFPGNYDFDIDSFAGDMAKQWKGRLNNLAMVVDLGPLKKMMTIKGNFNASKSSETNFGGKATDDTLALPTPEIEFSDELEPVIKILEILAQLSQGNYADALKKGLKVAMSNTANVWEYKFEATKDIPLVKFPLGALYDAPQTPLKLEASMSLGVYFNAALKVTTDPSQLLPTAGAFFKFHGGLQVMCVSVAAATIYAVGNVDLKISADTSPLIAVDMKFGFGAQIGVGLPVIGNVSILFMVGVEIYVDSTQKVAVSAFLLFRGHAEILGGIIGVTITIEAKGTIEKNPPVGGVKQPTNCRASVTFALDISIFLVIDISFSESWEETRQIA